MTESNNSPQNPSRLSLEGTSRDENRLPEAKDPNAPAQQTSIDRFQIIRDSVPKSALVCSSPHTLCKVKTYLTDIAAQSYYDENPYQRPPTHILKDLLQVDINEALGEGTSFILDRALVYMSEEGDVGFLAGPNPFSSAVVANPTRYLFQYGKSRNGADALGAWSALSIELPGIERDENVFEKLADSVKNSGEYPVPCTPIIFKGFSEKTKKRVLEAALKPQNRTLGAIDVSLEDGVTLFTQAEEAEERERRNVGDAAAAEGPLPAQSSEQGPKEEAGAEGEAKEVVPASDSELARTIPGKRTEKIDYGLAPAPMPPQVDASAFKDFDRAGVLPPEPSTPFDESEDSTTPSPSKQVTDQQLQQTVQPPSPSALGALFGVSNDERSEVEVAAAQVEEPAAPTANPGEVDEPPLGVSSPHSPPDPEQPGPVTMQDIGRPMFSQGVQTDEVEKEGGASPLQNAGQDSEVAEDVLRGADLGLDRADQTSLFSTPISPALVSSNKVVQQQPSADDGVQAVSTSEADFWTLISTLILVLFLPLIAALASRTSSQELPEGPNRAQNDVAAGPASRFQTPDLTETTPNVEPSGSPEPQTTNPADGSHLAPGPSPPTQAQPSTEEVPSPDAIAQPLSFSYPQEPVTESDASQLGGQVPIHEALPVSSVGSGEVEVQGLPQPTGDDPSTPAGTRRSRPKVTPPSADSQRRPPKRIRGQYSGDLGEVEGNAQPPVPLPPPVFENSNAEPDEGGEPQMAQESG